MVRRTYMAVAVALCAGLLTARADDKKPAEKPLDDAMFVKKAGSGGMLEVKLGKLAAEKGKSADVKKFGEMMVKDHSKANKALKTAAAAAGFEVPTKLMEEHEKMFDMFKDLSGEEFDRAYSKDMLKDHEEDVAMFTQASKELKSKELKDFAAKTLPTLKEHLEMAKKMNK